MFNSFADKHSVAKDAGPGDSLWQARQRPIVYQVTPLMVRKTDAQRQRAEPRLIATAAISRSN